ncbi:MAG: response regulator transcription factor [Clostridia bacterium]|nr:response regulator transcription factor [Clostridia bacterium]
MPEKILIADDEEGIISFIKDALICEGYEVMTATNGDQAVSCAMKHPDLIILDIMMPGKDGYEVCQAIRDIVSCPIIFLSALQSESDKIKGLAIGGDDYLTKPFSLRELKVRIQAHLRREKRTSSVLHKTFLKYRNLAIDLKGREVFCKDNKIVFTKREFDIIELLALHPGITFSKDQIYEKVWGYDAMGDSAGVAEHVKKIRSKLNAADSQNEYISTVWGVGYKWERIK